MKRTLSLSLGLVAFALVPVFAQTPAPKGPMGKIHGHVTGPEETSKTSGTISLSTDGGKTSKATFQVDKTGDYAGEAPTGTYTLVYRAPDTPPDKIVDDIENVKIIANQDILQDDNMARKEFIDKLSPDQKAQLEELKKHNAEALKSNAVINAINSDIRQATQDFKDADNARQTAIDALGASAAKSDIEAKDAEIRAAKYGEVETLMLKDTGLKPEASTLWVELGQAQVGLKKYDDAETNLKKALALESAGRKPNLSIEGAADASLGELYARTGKVPEANAAYDAAVKTDPTRAAIFLKNEAVIFFQEHNAAAQAAAADEAIKIDPTMAIAYYLKGNGLVAATTVDTKTNKLVPPAGCLEAYQKYLELAPTGIYAGEVKSILTSFQATLPTNAPSKSKRR